VDRLTAGGEGEHGDDRQSGEGEFQKMKTRPTRLPAHKRYP
jgi:hypothetical protein